MRDPAVDPDRALLLRYVSAVTAESERRVVIRFRRAYPEQFFDATFQVQPLPAHLVDTIPPARFAGSAFVQRPVGNGPYRWVAREPGRRLELAADSGFFLGQPKVDRVVFLLARDPDAQMNLLLDGTADVFEATPPVSGPPRLAAHPAIRLVTAPTLGVVYLLFNQRAYGDRSRPHPILADREVRRALAMAIDRGPLIRSTYGATGLPADAPAPAAHWTYALVPRGPAFDPVGAKALLARRGWSDHDGDGVLDKDGTPLSLRLNVTTTSAARLTMAPQIQQQSESLFQVKIVPLREQWRQKLVEKQQGDQARDAALRTQLMADADMDPSPSGIVQSWSCAGRGGGNVGQYCDPAVDSLFDTAISSSKSTGREWRAAYTALQADQPAVFLASPLTLFAVHSRFRNVSLRPESLYHDLWRWSVDPARRIARDGPAAAP